MMGVGAFAFHTKPKVQVMSRNDQGYCNEKKNKVIG